MTQDEISEQVEEILTMGKGRARKAILELIYSIKNGI